MSVTVTMQDYMAGWDLGRSVLLDVGIVSAASLLNDVVPKSVDDDMTTGLRECLRTAQVMGEIPMSSVSLFC